VAASRRLPRGGVALVENTRFWPGEEANDARFAETLAALGDFYVNDAFGSAHRAHASTEAVARLLRPAVTGLLMEKELRYLGEALEQPKRPFVAVLGGAKISGKIDVIQALLPKVDEILVGGAMANTFFLAIGFQVGRSLVERDKEDLAKTLLARAGAKLILPRGAVVAPSLARVPRRKAAPRGRRARGRVRRLLFAANWKMHLGPDEARVYLKTFRARYNRRDDREVWFFPPGVSVEAAAQAARDRNDLVVGV